MCTPGCPTGGARWDSQAHLLAAPENEYPALTGGWSAVQHRSGQLGPGPPRPSWACQVGPPGRPTWPGASSACSSCSAAPRLLLKGRHFWNSPKSSTARQPSRSAPQRSPTGPCCNSTPLTAPRSP
eukprot:1195160-Prorocentrum_minimum.AAC.15